jgi:hypothetical protein
VLWAEALLELDRSNFAKAVRNTATPYPAGPGPGADVAWVSPVSAQMWAGVTLPRGPHRGPNQPEPKMSRRIHLSPGADVGGRG